MIVKKKINGLFWTLDVDDVFPAYFDEVLVSCLKKNTKLPLFMGKSKESFDAAYYASRVWQWEVDRIECYTVGIGSHLEMTAYLKCNNYTLKVIARPYSSLDFFIER